MFAVMKHWDPMIGVDRHIPWPPGAPAPLPDAVPYVTVMILMGLQPLTTMYSTSCMTLHGWTMQRGTDIGPGIPHIGPPSLLTPLDILLSSSVSYFGPMAYHVEGAPAAAALLGVVNPNFNCQDPIALPTGPVLCITTHFTHMTPFDVLFGFISAAVDMVIGFAAGMVAGFVAPVIGKAIVEPIAERIAPKAASKAAATSRPAAAADPAPSSGPSRPALGAHRPAPTRPQDGPRIGAHRARPLDAQRHRPAGSTPWQVGRPGDRPPAHIWVPGKATPTQHSNESRATLGGHRKGKRKPTREELFTRIGLDILLELGLEAPMSLIHMLGMEVLALTGIEEFGAPIEVDDESEDDPEAGEEGPA